MVGAERAIAAQSEPFQFFRRHLSVSAFEHERYIRDVLLPGERILWMGRPRQGWVFTRAFMFLAAAIGGGLATGLWAGIVALGGFFGAAHAELVFGVAAPFIAIPIAFAACAEFAAIYRTRISYFVTDRRVGGSRRDVTANVGELPH